MLARPRTGPRSSFKSCSKGRTSRITCTRKGEADLDRAIELLIPAIDAVAFAHARGVIHRDLKPENIFLARDHAGAVVPKLLDFGISRIVTAEEQRMTATGMSIGTPAYMSPEQIRADKVVDARTDVWSLGVILVRGAHGDASVPVVVA